MTFGWTLVHFLWQGTAGAAFLALALLTTRSPRVRYAAGCVALALMALAPVLTYAWLGQSGVVRELGPVSLALGSGDALSRAIVGVEPIAWVAWLPLFWMVGVSALSARLILAAVSVHRLTHRESTRIPDAWPHLSQRLKLTRAVTFLTSTRLIGPAQAGFLKPVVLLPVSLLTQLPTVQLEAIIAHELAHIQRHDYLINLLQTAVETLLFYHPAVWWVSRVIRAERELCCDQLAADLTGNRHQYAEALLAVEVMAGGRLAFTNAATGGDLRQRIARLLGQTERTGAAAGMPALMVALLLAGAMLLPVRESRAQTPPPAAPSAASAQELSFWQTIDRWHRDFVHRMRNSPEKKLAAQPGKVTAYDKWLHEDVVYIISEPETKRFQTLKSDNEREQFIVQFWQRRDTTPATPENEAKQEHYRRIAKANQKFGTAAEPGWKTPRGRLYIVKGPPDELEMHPERKNEKWLYRSPREIFEFKL